MTKFCVQIYGAETIPEDLEIEAKDSNQAMDKAAEEVFRKLTFVIHSSQADPGAVFGMSGAPEIFARTCEIGILLGWDNISTLPGCQEHQIDADWWFAINPHNEPTRCSHGVTLRPVSILYEFQGCVVAILRGTGGLIATDPLANEQTLRAAIDAAIARLERPIAGPEMP